MNESDLQTKVADYLRQNYPDAIFHSDFGSGIKLTIGQATKQKRQNGGRRAWPDMFIAEPKIELLCADDDMFEFVDTDGYGYDGCLEAEDFFYEYRFNGGLFLELKRDGEKLYPGARSHPCDDFISIDGEQYRTLHLREQADMLQSLRDRGFVAEFAVGFEQAKELIDEYLSRPNVDRIKYESEWKEKKYANGTTF